LDLNIHLAVSLNLNWLLAGPEKVPREGFSEVVESGFLVKDVYCCTRIEDTGVL
jgi:hypothetical protein